MTIFVLHVHHKHCDACGRNDDYSQLYSAKDEQRGSHLQSCHSVGPTDPIQRLDMPVVHTPVCHACLDDDRAAIGHDVRVRWQETLKRKAIELATPTGPRYTKKPEPSLDDIA